MAREYTPPLIPRAEYTPPEPVAEYSPPDVEASELEEQFDVARGRAQAAPGRTVESAQRTSFGLARARLPAHLSQNVQLAVRGKVAAELSQDQAEIEKANRNLSQAQDDLARFLNPRVARTVPGQAPFVGSGSGLEQLMHGIGAAFVPLRQAIRHGIETTEEPKLGSQGSGLDWLRDTWAQMKDPAIRQTASDVIGEAFEKYGTPSTMKTHPARQVAMERYMTDLYDLRRRAAAAGRVVTRQEEQALEARLRAEQEAAPREPTEIPTKRLYGMNKPMAQLAGEVGEMAAPNPLLTAAGRTIGGMAKGAWKGVNIPTGIVPKGTLGAERSAVRWTHVPGLQAAADAWKPTRKLLDWSTFGGALRRLDPATPEWARATDEYLESLVASGTERENAARLLRETFQPLTRWEREVAIDAIEHPEILSGNPRLLEPLAQHGVNVVPYLSPNAALERLWRQSPSVAAQVDEQAARLLNMPRAASPQALPGDVLADLTRQLQEAAGVARVSPRDVWGARETLRGLHGATREARLAVDPLAREIDAPYIVHSSEQAAERALMKKGVPVAHLRAAEPATLEQAVRSQQGMIRKPWFRVHREYGRELNRNLASGNIERAAAEMGEPSVLTPPDTRLAMNAAMERIADPGTQRWRPYFSGRVLPQAQKIERDIEDTHILQLLRDFQARGRDVTDTTIEAMGAKPGGLGDWAVPQSPAWSRLAGDRKIAVPRPVQEFVDQLDPLGTGGGVYETLADILSARRPLFSRPGSYYSPLSELFKIPATVMNPRYYVRNWGGNIGQMYKEFGLPALLSSWSDDTKLVEAIRRGDRSYGMFVQGAEGPYRITAGEIEDLLRARGNLGATANPKIPIGPSVEQQLIDIDRGNPLVEAVARRLGQAPREAHATALKVGDVGRSLNILKPSVNPLVQGAAEKFGRTAEEAHRIRSTAMALRRGEPLDQAVKTAERLLFNPTKTSDLMLRLSGPMPFIRWWGKNIPLQARLAVEHPGRIYNIGERFPRMASLALDEDEQEYARNAPRGRYLSSTPLYWTGLEDRVGQPAVMPYPFQTESELYDLAEVLGGIPRGTVMPELWEAAMSRINPMAQLIGEPNRDLLRQTDIDFPLRDPSGEMIGYQPGTAKAGTYAELLHRAAESMGWPRGEELPIMSTTHPPASPFVWQQARKARYGELLPVARAFPFSVARLWDQNSTLPEWMRIPSLAGLTLAPIPEVPTATNRAFQTQQQIEQAIQTATRKRR